MPFAVCRMYVFYKLSYRDFVSFGKIKKYSATNNIQIRIESCKHIEIFTVRNYEKPHI